MVLANETHLNQWMTDYAASGYHLPRFMDVIYSCQGLPKAMGYADLAQDARNLIFDKLQEAKVNDGVLDLADWTSGTVTGYGSAITVTVPANLCIEAVAAKVAHCLWLESKRLFKWRLHEYTQTDLEWLLHPDHLFYQGASFSGDPDPWGITGTTTSTGTTDMDLVLDHSPYRAWQIVGKTAGGHLDGFDGNIYEAAMELYQLGGTFRHSNTSDTNLEARHMDWLHDVTLNGSQPGGPGQVSRTGCPFASRLWAAWCRAVNIPARVTRGVVGASGHHSAAWSAGRGESYAVIHGDDIYDGGKYDPDPMLNASKYKGSSWPLGPFGNFDYPDVIGLGWERFKSFTDFYGTDDNVAKLNYVRRARVRQRANSGDPTFPCQPQKTEIDAYLAGGWNYYCVSGGLEGRHSLITDDMDAMRQSMIEITGQDIP